MKALVEKLDPTLEKLAGRLDKMLQSPVDWLFAKLDQLFQYTYRETENGMYCLFESPEKISAAAKAAHSKGHTNFDCLTPFPVHGLEFDMGLKRSRVPFITFFAGLTGCAVGFGMQLLVHEQIWPLPIEGFYESFWRFLDGFPNLRSYPLNIGGKPSFAWPAMVPIVFELTVLIGGHTTVVGLILLAKMFRPFRTVLHPDITNDKFCLWIPEDSAQWSEDGVRQMMQELGADEITRVKEGEQSAVSTSEAQT